MEGMPKPSGVSAEKKEKKGLGATLRAALFGGAALTAAGAASAAEMPQTVELNKPTEYMMNSAAPAPEIRTPSGQKIELRVPDVYEQKTAAPLNVEKRELTPEPELNTLAPLPELNKLAPEPMKNPLTDFKL